MIPLSELASQLSFDKLHSIEPVVDTRRIRYICLTGLKLNIDQRSNYFAIRCQSGQDKRREASDHDAVLADLVIDDNVNYTRAVSVKMLGSAAALAAEMSK